MIAAGASVAACSLEGLSHGHRAVADGGETEGGGDAAVDGSSGPFCSTQPGPPQLCDDFDEGGFSGDWQVVEVNGGSVLLDRSGPSRSAPGALLAHVPGATTDPPVAFIRRVFPANVSHVRYAFSLLVEGDPGMKGGPTATIGLTQGAVLSQASLLVGERTALNEISYGDDGGVTFGNVYDLDPPIPLGVWTRVTIDLTFGAQGRVTIHLGDHGEQQALDHALGGSWSAGRAEILAGIYYTLVPTSAWSAHVDDLTYDAE